MQGPRTISSSDKALRSQGTPSSLQLTAADLWLALLRAQKPEIDARAGSG